MAAVLRLVLLCLAAGLALLGLALGAESQREVFLEPDSDAHAVENQGAAGNLVLLTAVLTAAGVAAALLVLCRSLAFKALAWSALAAVSTYALVVVGQSSSPNYALVVEARKAYLTNSLFAANLDAVPSLLVPVLALTLLALLGLGLAARRILAGKGARSADPLQLLRHQLATLAIATPFLAITAWGSIRVLLRLPSDQPGLGPYLVVLPAVALGALALMVLACLKTWHLGTSLRNARLAGSTFEAWQGLGRIEAAVMAALAGVAIAASFLAPVKVPDLELGTTFGATLRSHAQMTVLLGVPLLPGLVHHRRVLRALEQPPVTHGNLEAGAHPLAVHAIVACGASLLLAALATWQFEAALVAWVFATLPATYVAWRAGPVAGAPTLLLGAFLFWAIGNTVQATYDGNGAALLVFETPTGVLALWRTLGAVVAAVVVTRVARELGTRRDGLALAIGAGLGVVGIALLELPLTAWAMGRGGEEAVAVGSVLASLAPGVRATLHVIAAMLTVTVAILVALLHRPDWFERPRRPVAVVRPKAAAASASKAAS